MKKIIIDIQRPATVDRLEVELPAFTKLGNSYFCVTGESTGVQINEYKSIRCYSIHNMTKRDVGIAFDWEAETITKAEFEKALNTAYDSINYALNL
jgi:hypothetical protein